MPAEDPTADYRKYPKGPSFGLIVALSAITILVVAALAVFVLHLRARNMPAHKPDPTPNSMVYRPAETLPA